MIVLGIETSCDDTGIAIYDSHTGLLAHRLYSQVALHADYGGVVPELASRDHVRKALPLIQTVLNDSGLKTKELNGIAYTAGPGLIGALLVGAAIGRSLAFSLGIPALGVHHLEGHLLSPMLEPRPPTYPFTALLVSGGHTLLAEVRGIGRYRILGESLDDAAGEAFDKTAKLLGLGYPGGPAISREALHGNAARFRFPRPMLDRPGLDFSFSGLKTAVSLAIGNSPNPQDVADIAAGLEAAIVDTLCAKCERALNLTQHRQLVVAGGVSANRRLREQLGRVLEQRDVEVFFPRPEFCTDNGAMIAYAGTQRLLAGEHDTLAFQARPRWRIEELTPVTLPGAKTTPRDSRE